MRDFQNPPKESKTTEEIIKSDEFRRDIERVIMEADDVSYGPDGVEGYYDHLSAFDGIIRVIENSLLSSTSDGRKSDVHTNKMETLKHYANNFVVKNVYKDSDKIIEIELTNGGMLVPMPMLRPDSVTINIEFDLKVGDVISINQDLTKNNMIHNLTQLIVNGHPQKASIMCGSRGQSGALAYIDT